MFWGTILFASLVSKEIDKEATIIDLFRITGNEGFQHFFFFFFGESIECMQVGGRDRGR